MRNKLQTINICTRVNKKKIKSSRKKHMSCDRALNFDQWKIFSENYKPMRVWLWFVCKFTENHLSLATFLRVHSNSKEVSYLSWQNRYPNLKTTYHIKLKFFFWTKLLMSLLLAKYVVSVAAALNIEWYIFLNRCFLVPDERLIFYFWLCNVYIYL